MEGVIYKIENKVNGKVYIGQTEVGYKTRIGQHKSALRYNRHPNEYLQRAWNKYGEDNFIFSVVETCSNNDLDVKEVRLIAHHRKTTGAYNFESGGKKNKQHSDYSKAKMSKATKKAFKRPEVAKILKELAKKRRGKNNPNARRTICINTGKVFDTCTEAGKHYSTDGKNIARNCSGQRDSVGLRIDGNPLQFAYYEENKKYALKSLERNKKKIICITTGQIFDSVFKASEKIGASIMSIYNACKNKSDCVIGKDDKLYQVSYYEEGLLYNSKELKNVKIPKRVICVTTGIVYKSMNEASSKTGAQQSKISLCCNGKRKHTGKLPDGTKLKWQYHSDYLASK